jgi:hypothetical protein
MNSITNNKNYYQYWRSDITNKKNHYQYWRSDNESLFGRKESLDDHTVVRIAKRVFESSSNLKTLNC